MDTVVVGGGPAGMIASYFSALYGNKTILLEQNEKLGKKLYITGKGRCNVTNNCDPVTFLNNVVTNSRFMTSSIYGFTPEDLMSLLEKNGLRLKTERGNRVFPASDKSSDVIKTLASMLSDAGVEVRLKSKVTKITADSGKFCLYIDDECLKCDKVIIATGGMSYPLTGSTGDGYRFAKQLGHQVVEPKQALVPFLIKGDYLVDLAGLSLKNITLNIAYDNKPIKEEFGELLFTHQGVSGPVVLTASSAINRLDAKKITMWIDLKPALDRETLDKRILRDFDEFCNKELKNALGKLLPSGLIPEVIRRTKIDGQTKVNQIAREKRAILADIIKRFELCFEGLAPFSQAVVTAGGVNVKEINPKTMESKLVKGLFFAGEVIDVDALTGGFNLQTAFSTGVKAGSNEIN